MKNFVNVINALIFVAIVLIITMFLKYDIYEFDDYMQSFFYTFDFKTLFISADHAKYLSWFLMKSLCHGTSMLLHIHPNENIIPRLIIGLDFALLSFLYAKITAAASGLKKINPLIFISAFLASISLTTLHYDYLVRWNQHFEYIFVFLIFVWFITITADSFVNDRLPARKELVRNIILAALVSLSSYFNLFMAICILAGLGIFYHYHSGLSLKNFCTSEKYNYVRIPILIGLLFSVAIWTSPNLHDLFSFRLGGDINIFAFTCCWLKSLFVNPAAVIINLVLAGLFLISFRQNKRVTKAATLAALILLSSALFQWLLGFLGKTYLWQYYWVSFPRVYLVHYYFALASIFLLLGDVIKRIKYYVPVVILLLFGVVFTFCVPNFRHEFNLSKKIRQEMYMLVKAEQFYIAKNSNYAPAPLEFVDWDFTNYKDITKNWCIHLFYLNYRLIYKQNPLELKFLPKDEFLNTAKQDGLKFTSEELQTCDFNKLLQ